MSECPTYRLFFCIVIPISHKNIFPVIHFFPISAKSKKTWIVLQSQRERLRQTSARIYFAIKQHIACLANALSAQIHFQNRSHILYPRGLHRTSVMQHNDRVRLYFCNFFNQPILTFRHFHACSVISLRLKHIRQSCENHCNICRFCCFCRLFELLFIHFIPVTRKTFYICNIASFFHRCFPCRTYSACVNMTGTTSLISRIFCKLTDIDYFLFRFQRKHAIVF